MVVKLTLSRIRLQAATTMRRAKRLAAVGALFALAASGGVAMAQDNISIYFVGCAAPTGFHGYLARGAEEAGKNLGVKVTYIYPDQLTDPESGGEDRRGDRGEGQRHCALRIRRRLGLCGRRGPRQGGRNRIRQRRCAAGRRASARSQRHFPVPHGIRRESRRRSHGEAAHCDGREGQRRRRRPAAGRRHLPRPRGDPRSRR